MSLAFGNVKPIPIRFSGGYRKSIGEITFDGSYVNGTGYAIVPGDVGQHSNIHRLIVDNTLGYQFAVDIPNSTPASFKLRAYKGNTEAANNEAGLNGLKAAFECWGS